ncbi:hypothetical protein K461DRAFT_322740 [Myriangium duriaei CBS 260.36]|uniref:Rhodopsin domain-containing protein n=1 Tax=Myriangium duriaei CBS 260.36 TaxID=1168546 RepID=A0A9P4IZT4_9PEZI|nr:hypothetical protein K461DRAFT_322740 [Myriangium duriaei CBS 260.36]
MSTSTSLVGGVGPALLWTLWALTFVALLLVGLRGYAASRKNNRWRWDFIWIVLAVTCGLLASIFVTFAVMKGLGNHMTRLNLEQIYDLLRLSYFAIYMGTLSIAFSKFAVTALLLDVQQGSQNKFRRYILWAVVVIFTITTLLEIFLTAFQCHPLSKVWRVADPGSCPAQREARTISYVHSIIGGLTDVLLALFPISIVWNLQTTLQVKIGFCALMGLGVLPAIASFARYHLLHRMYAVQDTSYAEGLFMIWAAVEVGSLIILGSIPPLRPLFMRIAYGESKIRISHGASSRMPTRLASQVGTELATSNDKRVAKIVQNMDEEERILVSRSYEVETGYNRTC